MLRNQVLLVTVCLTIPAAAGEYLNGIEWQAPPIVTPGETNAAAPSDATVLWAGPEDLNNWTNADQWTTDGDALVCGKGKISTKDSFGDCQLHIEWSAPTSAKGSGQGRGNSGIFFNDRYEIQVLDSYQNETYHDGQAGAIYKQTPPMANAMRPPGQWNTYDILWTAPRFDDSGNVKSPARITAIHNGVAILNGFELQGDTPYTRPPQYDSHPIEGPISIQDHNNPVRFRNIWVRELTPATGEQVEPPFIRDGKKKTPIE